MNNTHQSPSSTHPRIKRGLTSHKKNRRSERYHSSCETRSYLFTCCVGSNPIICHSYSDSCVRVRVRVILYYVTSACVISCCVVSCRVDPVCASFWNVRNTYIPPRFHSLSLTHLDTSVSFVFFFQFCS